MRRSAINEMRLMIEDSLPHWKLSIEFWRDNDGLYAHNDDQNDYLRLTVSTNDWNGWGYQTGTTNIYGGAHDYRYWAEVKVWPESTADEILAKVVSQLEVQVNRRIKHVKTY